MINVLEYKVKSSNSHTYYRHPSGLWRAYIWGVFVWKEIGGFYPLTTEQKEKIVQTLKTYNIIYTRFTLNANGWLSVMVVISSWTASISLASRVRYWHRRSSCCRAIAMRRDRLCMQLMTEGSALAFKKRNILTNKQLRT